LVPELGEESGEGILCFNIAMPGDKQAHGARAADFNLKCRTVVDDLRINLSTLFFCNSGIDRLLAGSSSVGNQFTFLHNRRQQASSRQTANREPVGLSCDFIQHTSSGDNLH
jgi:hypothetical protein